MGRDRLPIGSVSVVATHEGSAPAYLRDFLVVRNSTQHRQAERSSLACPRLGLRDHIGGSTQ